MILTTRQLSLAWATLITATLLGLIVVELVPLGVLGVITESGG